MQKYSKEQMVHFGSQLRLCRLGRGMDRRELGSLLHYTPESICNWETGRYVPPDDTLNLIYNLFGTSEKAMFFGGDRLEER